MTVLDKLARAIEKADGWFNPLTAFGTDRDKTTASYFATGYRISDDELSALYHQDDMAGKIVDIVPDEMLRLGFKLTGPEGSTQAVEKIVAKSKALGVRVAMRDGFSWGRLFGGCVMVVGAEDGRLAIEPLDEANIRSITFLSHYDRRRAWPFTYYKDPTDPKFGQPEVWQLNGLSGGVTYVHETRTIVFRGARTADRERQQMQDWDYSVLQKAYSALRQFNTNTNAAELLITDASQAVFKMRGLLSALASPNGVANLQTRAALIDQTRSIARSIMLDVEAGEEFTKVPTQFNGVADMLDRSANRLAAAAQIPVTLLMGQAPAGLNATGESDVRVFYDRIKSEQENTLRPRLERMIQLIKLCEKVTVPITISFDSLWQETPKEQAERRKIVADTDAIYLTNEVVTPEEIAESRYGGEAWSAETKIDMSLREPGMPLPGALPPKPAPASPGVAPGGAPPGPLRVQALP
jgi:phage-related protein (TIGR01555 family)